MIYLSVKRIIIQVKGTLKLVSVFLGHDYWILRALVYSPLIHFFQSTPIEKVEKNQLNRKPPYLSKSPFLTIIIRVLHSLIQPNLVVSNWSVLW